MPIRTVPLRDPRVHSSNVPHHGGRIWAWAGHQAPSSYSRMRVGFAVSPSDWPVKRTLTISSRRRGWWPGGEPSTDRPLRPWLAKVMLDTFRMRRRTQRRRAAREARTEQTGGVATPDELLEQVRLHKLLVELALALDEPFRSR